MTAGQAYVVYPLTVAPGATEIVSFPGRYVTVLESNQISFDIGIDGTSPQPVQQGLTLITADGEQFTNFQVFNPNGSDLVVQIATGLGEVKDSRFSATGVLLVQGTGAGGELTVDGNGPTDEVRVIGTGPGDTLAVSDAGLAVANTFESFADFTVATALADLVAASNTARRRLRLTSLKTNNGEIRIGDATVAAAEGIPLDPGESVWLETTADVYAFSTAAGQVLSRAQESTT